MDEETAKETLAKLIRRLQPDKAEHSRVNFNDTQ